MPINRILFLQTRDSEKIPVGADVDDALGDIADALDAINGEVVE